LIPDSTASPQPHANSNASSNPHTDHPKNQQSRGIKTNVAAKRHTAATYYQLRRSRAPTGQPMSAQGKRRGAAASVALGNKAPQSFFFSCFHIRPNGPN